MEISARRPVGWVPQAYGGKQCCLLFRLETAEDQVADLGRGSFFREPGAAHVVYWSSSTHLPPASADTSGAQANPAEFESVPLDERASLVRETKRSGFERRRAPTLQDFPKEWL